LIPKGSAGVAHPEQTLYATTWIECSAASAASRFETIEEAQTYLDRWDANWADKRIHGTTNQGNVHQEQATS
jgi:hypothetical protein